MATPGTKITENGLKIAATRMIGTSEAVPSYVGWGTADYAVVDTEAKLTSNGSTDSEVAADLSATSGTRFGPATMSTVNTTHTNDTAQFVQTCAATGAGTIYQVGLFNNSAIRNATSSFLLANFGGITMVSGDSIEFTIKIQFTH